MLQPKCYFSHELNVFHSLFEECARSEVSFKRGEYLKPPSVYMDWNYYIISGFCRVSVLHDSGYERVIGYWGEGSMYPIITNAQQFYLENMIVAIAMTDVVTLQISPNQLRAAITQNPALAFRIIDHYGAYTNLLKFESTSQTYEEASTRVCNMLYIFYLNYQNKPFNLTQSELASMVGLRRESVVKVVRKLRAEGIIDPSDRHLRISDPERLLNACSFLLQ